MKKVTGVRVVLGALAIAFSAATYVALLPAPKAMPSPGVCTYYSNSKYKVVVGQFGTGCCGEQIGWGTITPYRKCEQVWCLDIVCPNPTE
jgi:hypothetical protein